jgi:hypothetical protein
MRGTTLAGLALSLPLALAIVLGSGAPVRADDKGAENDPHAGKRETIRGIIAGVTVEGETAIDYASHRAQTAEMAFLTVVGIPVGGKAQADRGEKANANDDAHANDDDKNKNTNRDRVQAGAAGRPRHRHNVYILWLTPRTEVCDATGSRDRADADKAGDNGKKIKVGLNALEVGDGVEVTFHRREVSTSGDAADLHAQWARRHGRHRTYFGDAVSISILSEPAMDREAAEGETGQKNRDDNKDKVQSPER